MSGFDAIKSGVCVAVLASVAACTVNCPSTEIGMAARYSDDGFSAGPPSRLNQWIASPRLDDFLRRKIQSEGLASLSKRYGLQCIAHPAPEGCSTCSLCTTSFSGEVISMSGVFFVPRLYCADYGQVSIRAEIGPGDAVKSMTYWAVPAAVRKE
jgi:hypothetical protein